MHLQHELGAKRDLNSHLSKPSESPQFPLNWPGCENRESIAIDDNPIICRFVDSLCFTMVGGYVTRTYAMFR